LSVIKTSGGSVDKVDIWGRRRLAYDIQKKSEGIYAVVDFSATADTAKELDRQLGLNEVVLRTKVMRVDAAKVAKAAKAAEAAKGRQAIAAKS